MSIFHVRMRTNHTIIINGTINRGNNGIVYRLNSIPNIRIMFIERYDII